MGGHFQVRKTNPCPPPIIKWWLKMFKKLRKKLQKDSNSVYPIPITQNVLIGTDKISNGVSSSVSRRVRRVRTDEQINKAILDFIKLSNKPLTTSDIGNYIRIRHRSAKNRLRFMKFAGLVECYERGSWVYWKIKR